MKKVLLSILSLAVLVTSVMWSNQVDPSVQLWGSAVSPYVRKVISVLEEKNIPYTLHPILPTAILEATGKEVPAEFKKISPLGKIPALQVGDFSINDSAVIAAYVERKWPEIALYPKNPEAFARVLWLERYSDTAMTEVFHKILFENFVKPNELKLEVDTQLVAELVGKLPSIYSYLELQLQKSEGQYLVGSTPTIADMAVIHHFVSLTLAGISIELQEYPLLSKYVEHVQMLPSIQAAIRKI
jgi:glutathione S-transferase